MWKLRRRQWLATALLQEAKNIVFAGANTPLWIVRKTDALTEAQKADRATVVGENYSLIEFKGDKQPIGLYQKMTPFQSQEVELLDEDVIYLSSDGFVDQFGGPKGKKYKSRNLKTFLLSIHQESFESQGAKLKDELDRWSSGFEQTDDIWVLGFSISA